MDSGASGAATVEPEHGIDITAFGQRRPSPSGVVVSRDADCKIEWFQSSIGIATLRVKASFLARSNGILLSTPARQRRDGLQNYRTRGPLSDLAAAAFNCARAHENAALLIGIQTSYAAKTRC